MNWPVECHSRACSPFFGKNQTEYHSLVHILASPKNYVYSLTHPHNACGSGSTNCIRGECNQLPNHLFSTAAPQQPLLEEKQNVSSSRKISLLFVDRRIVGIFAGRRSSQSVKILRIIIIIIKRRVPK